MSVEEIGCCGAYCRTCKVMGANLCQGCKLGYADGTRDILKAKCKMKVCCISKGYVSCADCDELESCEIMRSFFVKNGYKYTKYKQAIMFIRENGYEKFFLIANTWKMQYGKYAK